MSSRLESLEQAIKHLGPRNLRYASEMLCCGIDDLRRRIMDGQYPSLQLVETFAGTTLVGLNTETSNV